MIDLIAFTSLFLFIVGIVIAGYLGVRWAIYLWHSFWSDDEEYWRF